MSWSRARDAGEAQRRVLYVDAVDGLEDKLEPDAIGSCLAVAVSALRKETLTVISEILKKLGEVMDTSADKGQERFLLFAAVDLVTAAVPCRPTASSRKKQPCST